MRSKNSNSTIGHLGHKPELKKTPNGTPYTRFTVYCNFSFMKDKKRVNDVDRIPFIAYGKLAEVAAKYLDKGSHVSIESRLKPWTSGEGDNKRYGINVVVTDLLFLDSNKNQAESPEHVDEIPAGIPNDDIPF